MANNETPKPPSTHWEQQLFSCAAHGHRVSGIDCDTYFKSGHGCPPGPCALRDRMLGKCEGLADPVPVVKIKHCRGCEKDLPVAAFSRHAQTDDGYAHICKTCFGKKISRGHKDKKGGKPAAAASLIAADAAVSGADPGLYNPPTPQDTTAPLVLDFSRHPDLLAALEDSARVDFRDPPRQVLAILDKVFFKGGRHAA